MKADRFFEQLYENYCDLGRTAMTRDEFREIAMFVVNGCYRPVMDKDFSIVSRKPGHCGCNGEEVSGVFREYRGKHVLEHGCEKRIQFSEMVDPVVIREDMPTPFQIRKLNHE